MIQAPDGTRAPSPRPGAVLIVGGDRVGAIAGGLAGLGYAPVRHHRGRATRRVVVPADTALVVVLIDYCSHKLMEAIRQICKARGIPVVYGRRAWSALEPVVRRAAKPGGGCSC